ncbi:GTP-binding protein [Zoogloea sp.]|uniref:GTP-binding protein n=1 Tax=Zoogloea sp. TaxID=49181 RepID=UPI001AD16593|nr:GTP-binding protein [Zoogloea sp.]MBN8283086.1 hypothetical protein [Zoogloea sp.]
MSTLSSPRNFAIFGAAHAGKSSLAGFCTLRTGGLNGTWESFLHHRRVQLGAHFDVKQKFAYIVDRGPDEQIRQHDGIGQSRRLHPTTAHLRIDGRDVPINMIDTPGAQHVERETYSGMFMGDMGIFVAEINRLLEDGLGGNREFLAQLVTWIEFKRRARFLIVLTKFDQCGYSRDRYDSALHKIGQMLEQLFHASLCYDVIPTAIDMITESDQNVVTPAIQMPWYKGPTLLEWIQDSIRRHAVPAFSGMGKLAYVEGEYRRKAREVGVPMLLQGKVLNGGFSVGDVVKIAPVRLGDGSHGTATARIRSLRPQGGEIRANLEANELGGFALTSIRGGADLRLCKSTCLFGAADKIAVGRAIVMRLQGTHRLPFVGELFTLIWFGKLISCHLVGCTGAEKELHVFEAAGAPVALASPFDAPAHNVFYLRRGSQNDAPKFIPATVTQIGVVSSISVTIPDALLRVGTRLQRRKIPIEHIDDTSLEVSCKDSAINTVRQIEHALLHEASLDVSEAELKKCGSYMATVHPSLQGP